MKFRPFGKTGFMISEIALGTWQLGGKRGEPVNVSQANETLEAAVSSGINAFDTADVYQGGMSETLIGKFIQTQIPKPFVITKVGRRLPKQDTKLYTKEALLGYIMASRERLNQDALDMVLLHCPPTDLYDHKEIFGWLDDFKKEGLIKHYGVSVEKVIEAKKALEYPGVDAIEIIFNMFRLKPMREFFDQAKEKNVGIIVRVPLASGLLTGKYHERTTFGENDHRTFNRNGESFDKGETFSGVDYFKGLEAVSKLKKYFKTEQLYKIALRWILMFDQVSTVIPGASRKEQILENVEASKLPPLSKEDMDKVEEIYNTYIKSSVEDLW